MNRWHNHIKGNSKLHKKIAAQHSVEQEALEFTSKLETWLHLEKKKSSFINPISLSSGYEIEVPIHALLEGCQQWCFYDIDHRDAPT